MQLTFNNYNDVSVLLKYLSLKIYYFFNFNFLYIPFSVEKLSGSVI